MEQCVCVTVANTGRISYRFTQDRPYNESELEELRQRLQKMSMGDLVKFYQDAYWMCRYDQKPTRAAFVQHLVQAWKMLTSKSTK